MFVDLGVSHQIYFGIMHIPTTDFGQLLDIEAPWRVSKVTLTHKEKQVQFEVVCEEGAELTCPECGAVCPGYDHRTRKWRHLDVCRYQSVVIADVPRVKCRKHGVRTVSVSWADRRSRFTGAYEALVIDWLKEASVSAVSRLMGLSWNAVDGIMQRAVKRGLARRQEQTVAQIGVDETSFRRRHNYVTIVSDTQSGTVLYVGEDRKISSLTDWYEGLSTEQLNAIKSVSMDMWPAYISATKAHVPDAEEKIAFDRFHVAKHLGEAVDKVRRQEHKALMKEGVEDLKGTKYDWLTAPGNLSRKKQISFKKLRSGTYKTARAWHLKHTASHLWHYSSRTWAKKGWKKWLSWAVRCRLDPMKAVAKTIRNHLWGIINAIVLNVSNGPAEGLNSRVKTIKVRCRGFRNKQRFANAIYFYLGGLDLYPECVK